MPERFKSQKSICGVCGKSTFSRREILWDALIKEWQLTKNEVAYINHQQGTTCKSCGSNIRSIALANAIRSFFGTREYLKNYNTGKYSKDLSVLEINEAGNLTPILRTLGNYTFGAYPEIDMHQLPYSDKSFDLVVHSDTLEHVKKPVHALRECRRVLKERGALAYTVPIIVGRLSRIREGQSPSYHGNPETDSNDYIVQTEYGADAWTQLMDAGFNEVSIYTVDYPSGIAFLARK